MKKLSALLLLLCILAVMPFGVAAESSVPEYTSYTYNSDGEPIAAPEAFTLSQKIQLKSLGINIDKLTDMDIDTDGNIYLVDSGTSSVIKLSDRNVPLLTVSEFSVGEKFSAPCGVSVGADGYIYVADTGNGRIVKLSTDLKLIKIFEKPSLEDAQYDYEYKPLCVEADAEGRFYVIAESQTQGIMQFDKKGAFLGYYGATKVSPSVFELFLRKFATQEQLKGMIRFIPTEYRNMALDEEGFMYCTVSTYSASEIRSAAEGDTSVTPIRRLNQSGKDILLRNGPFAPVGDVDFSYVISDSISGASTLVDIAAYKNNIYSVLDSRRGRVFTYNKQGELLYIFGSRGNDNGAFISPAALAYRGDDILVLDSADASVSVFKATEYAELVLLGIEQYQNGEYEAEKETWNKVLDIFPHSTLALKELGKAFYNNKDFSSAMEYFRKAQDRTYYSKALEEYIQENASRVMTYLLPVITILAIIYIVISYLRKKGKIKSRKRESNFAEKHPKLHKLWCEVKYSGYVVFHPFDGFWDLKHEKRGSVASASVILAAAIVSNIIRIRWMPFLFNENDFTEVSALYKGIMNVIALVLLWCISNWCFTTLMDGKGKMRDIYIYTCYALAPIAVLFPVITAISYFLYISSAAFLTILIYMIIVWVGFLIIAGTVSTHDYSFGKAILTIILTVVGMMVIAFLALLIFSIAQEACQFFKLLFNEISSRL
ncbi:MAG: hypothetical protein IKB45_04980 [Clostridia bacterium]|nr:hypothetical protein [Clostridia bacterium]